MPFSLSGCRPSYVIRSPRWAIATPTPVQTESIPVVLSGRDLLARAQTGTGKTAAFGLPMIDRLLLRERRPASTRKPRGLVLVPTRELALQVHKALATYGAPARLRGDRHLRRRADASADSRRCSAAPTSSWPRRAGCWITWSSAPSICRPSRS